MGRRWADSSRSYVTCWGAARACVCGAERVQDYSYSYSSRLTHAPRHDCGHAASGREHMGQPMDEPREPLGLSVASALRAERGGGPHAVETTPGALILKPTGKKYYWRSRLRSTLRVLVGEQRALCDVLSLSLSRLTHVPWRMQKGVKRVDVFYLQLKRSISGNPNAASPHAR